jgi:hypothetical protein
MRRGEALIAHICNPATREAKMKIIFLPSQLRQIVGKTSKIWYRGSSVRVVAEQA